MHLDDTTFRDLVDAELGDAPPAPADRLEWVVRAPRSNGPRGRTGRLPRGGYLAVAVFVLSAILLTGLVVSARISSGQPAVRDSGDSGQAVVPDTATPPGGGTPATRLGSAVSTSPTEPTHRAAATPPPEEATVRPRVIRPTVRHTPTTVHPPPPRRTGPPSRPPTESASPTDPPASAPPVGPILTPVDPTPTYPTPTPNPSRTHHPWP